MANRCLVCLVMVLLFHLPPPPPPRLGSYFVFVFVVVVVGPLFPNESGTIKIVTTAIRNWLDRYELVTPRQSSIDESLSRTRTMRPVMLNVKLSPPNPHGWTNRYPSN